MIEVENLRSTADEMLSGLHAPPGMAQRLRLQAGALDNLPQIAGEMLGSLQAGPALRHRILVAADRARHPFRLLAPACPRKRAAHPGLLRLTPALGMAVLLVIMLGVGSLYGGTVPGSPSNELESYAAGPVQTLSDVSQFRSLFAGEGANPPLLAINGRYYRMLTTPLAVSSSLVGAPIADVQTYTDEPSLSTRVGVVSNVVAERSQVYEVTGLSQKTAVAAEVDGTLRLFQRVSYAAASLIGEEMFEDTLDVGGQVASLELSGVGVVNDETRVNELLYMLNEFAVWSGSEIGEADQALTIYLKNGLSLQLLVDGDVLWGCGAWACPEFFDAFAQAVV